MDLGPFVKSPWRTAAWIAIPPILAVALHVGVTSYVEHVHVSLERTRGLVKLVPLMEKALADAEALIGTLPPPATTAPARAARLGERISTLATVREVTLLSFTTIEAGDGGKAAAGSYAVALQGDWSNLALLLNDLQGAEPLASVDRLSLTSGRSAQGDAPCKLELRISIHDAT